jgi:hypothetical protein
MCSYHPQHLETAVEKAMDAFWQIIVEHYPTAESGDLSPLTHLAFDEAARTAVAEWVNGNVPKREALGACEPTAKRYRVHFRELGYYQAVLNAASPEQAVRIVHESPPDLTFIASEDRDVFGIDQLRPDRTWQMLPDSVIDDA